MAMACIHGDRECDGCMMCQAEPKKIGICASCGAPIYEGDDRYRFWEALIHADCLLEWVTNYRVVI